MPPTTPPEIKLRLLYQGGREPQFTILGSERSLEVLALSIQDALKARKEPNTYWGSTLATVLCPHGEAPLGVGAIHFAVESSEAALRSSRPPAFGNWWAASLSLVGAASLLFWAFRLWV